MDSICEKIIKDGYGFCPKVNRSVPASFCRMVCKGEKYEQWAVYDPVKWRRENMPKLTARQKSDKRIVTVVMPAKECEKPYIEKTIDSLKKTAAGDIETIVICDGWTDSFGDFTICNPEAMGQRASVNKAVKYAKGDFIFRLDPHCAMSEGWDARMKSSCCDNCLVVPVVGHLDVEKWCATGDEAAFWYLDGELKCHSVYPWKPLQARNIEEDVMGISGGMWMVRKDYYESLGGHNEMLGRHGNVGVEWALKVWLTGGRCLIRTDVVCAHLFRTKSPYGYDWAERENGRALLYKMWVEPGDDPRKRRPIEWLLYKFNDFSKRRPLARTRMK